MNDTPTRLVTALTAIAMASIAATVTATAVAATASPTRYTYPATGTVFDTKTKLTWQQTAPTTTYVWAAAPAVCAGLNLAGTGWRLPTAKELLTLVDESRSTPPLIDPTAFPATPAVAFWSSSRRAQYAWYVAFNLGSTDLSLMTEANAVRCVR
ncbi:MAG TPA: DUF1566 domain-containing protein [Polyangia bacterium]|nr:DUF1566 domain-containing protein [Polyangia bacterium]